MRISSLRPGAHRLVTGTALVAASVLVSSLTTTVGVAAAAPIPPAPPLLGSTQEQVIGSAEGLGRNLAGQMDGSGLGPTVLTGEGTGPGRYVALGDSYAAVGRAAPGSWGPGPVTCVRTDDAYPTVVARELGVGTFVNATCGGAVTDDLWEPNDEVPAQFEALTADTDLVTLTIGGNDAGFGAVGLACAVRPNADALGLVNVVDTVAPLLNEDDEDGEDDGFDTSVGCAELVDGQATEALQELDDHLDAVYEEIARRAPDARIVTVGYLSVLPDDSTIDSSPDCALLDATSPRDREAVRHFQSAINGVVRDAGERNGATVVIPDEPGHSICSPVETRWVDLLGHQTGATPIHPTSIGHAHVAEKVVGVLVSEG